MSGQSMMYSLRLLTIWARSHHVIEREKGYRCPKRGGRGMGGPKRGCRGMGVLGEGESMGVLREGEGVCGS